MISNRAIKYYQIWMSDPHIDEATKKELDAIKHDENEIEERFYKDLEFGTGGLRGIIGAGTNRMNKYSVRRSSQGLANYLIEQVENEKSVVIAYDSRHFSREFAVEAALVFAGNGIKTFVFSKLRPTPELSFAVRHLKACAGIVITASHNPPEYNGFKVYDATGGQLIPEVAEQVIKKVQEIENFNMIKRLSLQEAESENWLQWIHHEVDRAYIQEVLAISPYREKVTDEKNQLMIVYTPLHGSGNDLVREVLKQKEFRQVHIVTEQELPDPQFSTVTSPNPEEKEAFTLAISLAHKIDADLIIGTDPDCDRVGAVVKDDKGQYTVLNGNQIGALILNYLLSQMEKNHTIPQNGIMIKSIVTSELGTLIAQKYGIDTINTLTGFKYIGEKITEFERTRASTFVFGYEESFGYLTGTYARDKDAVVASMLLCEAAATYKKEGATLYSVLKQLYLEYGYFMEKQVSTTLKGKDGVEKIKQIMDSWRQNPVEKINGVHVIQIEDYDLGIYGLPKENVLKYKMADDSWFCLRPSGTEPKIKYYFAVKDKTHAEATAHLEKLTNSVLSFVH
jgi:phosphoglucomutase